MRLRLRILVIEDDATDRRALKQLLIDAPEVRSVGEAGTCRDAVTAVHAREWDAVVVGAGNSGPPGIHIVRRLKQERPDLPLLVLVPHAEDSYARRAVRAGASGSLATEATADALLGALKALSGGGRWDEARVSRPVTEPARPKHAALSDREFQVMRRLVAGKSTWDIARELGLQAKTVNLYRVRIFRKLEITTQAGLIQYAQRHGLME